MELSFILSNTTAFDAGFIFGKILGVVLLIAIPALFILSLVKTITKKSKGWIALLIITSLAGLTLSGFIAYFAVKKIQENTSPSGETQSIVSDDGVLQLEIPAGWHQIDTLHDEASVKYGHERREQYIIVLTEPKSDFQDSTSLRNFADLCSGLSKEALTNVKLGEWKEVDVTYGKLLKVDMTAAVDHLKIHYLYGYYETEHHFHQIMQWTLPSQWEKSLPLFEKVLTAVEPVSKPPQP